MLGCCRRRTDLGGLKLLAVWVLSNYPAPRWAVVVVAALRAQSRASAMTVMEMLDLGLAALVLDNRRLTIAAREAFAAALGYASPTDCCWRWSGEAVRARRR